MGFSKEMFIDIQNELMDKIHNVEQGNTGLIPALVELEGYRKSLDDSLAIIKEFKSDNINEIETQAKDYQNEYGGYKIEVRSGGRMYNYKMVEEWQTYDKAKKECEDRLKQALLSKEKGLMVASEDGEEIQFPEVSYRKNSLILKKI